MHSLKNLRTGTLLCLLLSLTGCASGSSVSVNAVQCQHPVVDVSTNGGLNQGLLDYADALDQCNILNGFPIEEVQ